MTQPNPTAVSIQLGEDGAYELRVALEDQAGNVRPLADAQPVMLRLDTQAPRAAINELDPNEPMLAAANVTDAASGLADGQLEMRRRGTRGWHELTTTVDHSRLLATIDDERFHEGSYELRARAIDHAGNETSTGDESGSAATRQLPVRIRTRLRAGHVIIKTRRRVVGRGKHKRVVRRRTISLDKSVRVRFGAHTVLGGRLTDVNGQPLHDVPVEVSAQPRLPAAGFGPIGLVRTDKDGRFTYRVAGTQSRRLRFRYPGTSRIQPSRADVSINVPASTTLTLTPPRILNGETVTFSGRVRGGPIPTAGKLIELKKWTGRQWAPFRVVRTGPDGRWSHVEPVLSVRGLVVFKLRADVPAESGFPFAGGHSPTRRLHVRGL